MVLHLKDYNHACKIAAKVVAMFGDEYLPIFERTHKEFEMAEQKKNLKLIAMEFATKQN